MAHVADCLSIFELKERYRAGSDACSTRHFQGICLWTPGHTIEEVAETTCLLARYNALSPEALGDLRRNNGARAHGLACSSVSLGDTGLVLDLCERAFTGGIRRNQFAAICMAACKHQACQHTQAKDNCSRSSKP